MENINNDNSILLSIKYNIGIKNKIKESISNIIGHTEYFYSEYDDIMYYDIRNNIFFNQIVSILMNTILKKIITFDIITFDIKYSYINIIKNIHTLYELIKKVKKS